MLLIDSIPQMQRTADELRINGKRIGFVPTMGALHQGHLDLIRTAAQTCDTVVVSVFVNPSQFGKGEDLSRYPRNLERDQGLAADAGCDILFVPDADAIYPEGFCTWVQVEGLGGLLEGAFRPTHFRGVTTVVTALFNIVKPHLAVFGQKDAQQALIIRRMVRDLHMDIELHIAPTRRESDGLAMSSRNTYLSDSERERALALSRALTLAEAAFRGGERDARILRESVQNELRSGGVDTVDYVALVDAENLEELEWIEQRAALLAIAARVGTTRLIDNTILKVTE
ncbi:MAG: pantoate--beta-alanine ligase [Bacteroidia bacterium]|nr:pantoate--beta-alanine ligase [Bacteroidia bacterium]